MCACTSVSLHASAKPPMWLLWGSNDSLVSMPKIISWFQFCRSSISFCKSTINWCLGFGSLKPCSRNNLHCCFAAVFLPFTFSWHTLYAEMIARFLLPFPCSMFTDHLPSPRPSSYVFATLDAQVPRIIDAHPPGWYNLVALFLQRPPQI